MFQNVHFVLRCCSTISRPNSAEHIVFGSFSCRHHPRISQHQGGVRAASARVLWHTWSRGQHRDKRQYDSATVILPARPWSWFGLMSIDHHITCRTAGDINDQHLFYPYHYIFGDIHGPCHTLPHRNHPLGTLQGFQQQRSTPRSNNIRRLVRGQSRRHIVALKTPNSNIAPSTPTIRKCRSLTSKHQINMKRKQHSLQTRHSPSKGFPHGYARRADQPYLCC